MNHPLSLEDFVWSYPDFPKPGILFRDVSPMLASPEALAEVTTRLAVFCETADVIVGLDARGFLFGALVAERLKKPFVMIRKKGKLPGETETESYDLEYGSATIEIQKDALQKGARVAIIDDLLATWGTVLAATNLLERIGAKIECIACVISLDDDFLSGFPARKSIREKFRTESVLQYK